MKRQRRGFAIVFIIIYLILYAIFIIIYALKNRPHHPHRHNAEVGDQRSEVRMLASYKPRPQVCWCGCEICGTPTADPSNRIRCQCRFAGMNGGRCASKKCRCSF